MINGWHVCDETTYNNIAHDPAGGYHGRDLQAYPRGVLKCAQPKAVKRLTKQEIKEAIEYKDANKSWITDMCDRVGLKRKNQSQSSYCWIHAPVHAIECMRVVQNDILLVLSAFYAGSQIKNGRNVGGSGVEGMEWLVKHGTCLESLWPPMQFRGNVTAEIIESAERHQIVVDADIDPDDHELIASYVCADDPRPVTVGIPAWGHEVLITRYTWDTRRGIFLPIHDNSWGMDWGTEGRGVLDGRYNNFDEAGVIEAVEPSSN